MIKIFIGVVLILLVYAIADAWGCSIDFLDFIKELPRAILRGVCVAAALSVIFVALIIIVKGFMEISG